MKPSPRAVVIPDNVQLLARVKSILRRAKLTPAKTATVKKKLKQLRDLAYRARSRAYAALKYVGVSRKQADTQVESFEESQRRCGLFDAEVAEKLRTAHKPIDKSWSLMRAIKRAVPEDELEAWLEKPHPGLDGRKPADLIASGEHDALFKLIRNARQSTHA